MPTPEWIEKFKGKFDMGWNAMREQIFANQKRLGVIPANTPAHALAGRSARNGTRSIAESKKLFARQAEVFAAYVAYTDHEIGRVIQAVDDMGKLDNTLVIYIERRQRHERRGLDDRHAERDGHHPGRRRPGRGADEVLRRLGLGPRPTPHMSVAWSWAFDTPFKWTKQVASHFGGTRQGMAISWPNRDQGCRRHPHTSSTT